MLVAGVDEAGRGPVIGPMVLCCAVIDSEKEEELEKLGPKDSKLLSPKQRKSLYAKMGTCLSNFAVASVDANEIDSLRGRRSLNEIEAMRIGGMLNSLKEKPELVLVDSPDIIMGNFSLRIKKYISFDCVVRSEHRADFNYPIVAAASIIAKVERDRQIAELCRKHGDLGSGYCHDAVTLKFLREWLDKNNCLPEFSRKSWCTSKMILDEKFQKKLEEW